MHTQRAFMPSDSKISTPNWLVCGEKEVSPAFQSFSTIAKDNEQMGLNADEPSKQPHQAHDLGEEEKLAQELAALKEHAQREGFEEGKAQALVAFDQEIEKLRRLLSDLEQARSLALYGVEQQLADLSLAIVQEILQEEYNDEHLIQWCKDSIAMMGESEEIKISASPQDIDVLQQTIDELNEAQHNRTRYRLVADSNIERGCFVDTPLAEIDATIKGRISRIRAALLGASS